MGISTSQRFAARVRFLCLSAVLAVAIPSAARAATLTFDFASGMDPYLFNFSSSRSEMILDDTGGNLRLRTTTPISLPGSTVHSAAVSSTFFLQGDFLIKIAYTLNSPIVSGEQVQFTASSVAVVRSLESGNNNYHVWDGSTWRGQTSTTDTFGQFQLSRTGTQLTGSIYRGSNTTPENLYTMTVPTTDFPFGLGVNANSFSGWSGSQSFDVAYDNLDITADALIGVPEPSTFMLVGLGLLGLIATRRRHN